ncbi:hypothetical protein GCM10010302_75140 [Streptomyces polychromogenes]|uniref:Barstar (barnase inhibitor) domain-containing protein n=1 Tax=Streptomyces polychromogenes TaxID=67342 RepID=A0ABP3FST9_9ACTN
MDEALADGAFGPGGQGDAANARIPRVEEDVFMEDSARFRVLSAGEADRVFEGLSAGGARVVEVDTKGARDGESIVRAFSELIEMDPPLSGRWHPDAFSDSLFGGLHNLEESHVVVVLCGGFWVKERFGAVADTLEILGEVGDTLAEKRFTGGVPTELVLFVVVETDWVESLQ